MPLTSIVLEYSSDPVSDATPTWVVVPGTEIRHVEWWAGVNDEGDDLEPGGASIVLVNVNRKWEPFFGSNLIDTHQRFRLTLNGTQQGVWFITSISLGYPGNTEWSEVTFECGDGTEVLALDHLPALDPPDAESYEDVVAFDEPWGYWRLGDPVGTQAVANFRRRKRKPRKKVRRGTRYITASETGAVSGPAGVYKTISLVTLGEDGVILGDPDTSAKFDTSGGAEGRVAIPIEDGDSMTTTDGLSVECWFKVETTSLRYLVTAARNNALGQAWVMAVQTNDLSFDVRVSPSTDIHCEATSVISLDTWYHAAATYDAGTINLYLDGVLVATASGAAGPLVVPTAGNSMFIAFSEDANQGFDGWIDEVAVYERALTPERVLAHYQAGAERGFERQTAGARISAVVTSGLWNETGVQTSGRDVVAGMMHGQPRLDEIAEAMRAEGPSTLFFFDGDGNPVYLGHEWRATAAAYNTVQAVFGQSEFGEVPVDSLEPVYDHETFNVIQASCEGSGDLVEMEDTTASGKRGRRVLDDYTGLLLADHIDTESLAASLLATYKDPVRRVEEISVTGWDDQRLNEILALDVGHLVRVNWSGETGARNGQTANIIRKHKSLDNTERPHVLRCSYRLGRGFDATETATRAGIVGRSEAGVTTYAA